MDERGELERPILVREVIGRDAPRAFELRVFCPPRAQSVALDVCRACPAFLEVAGDPSGASAWLRCAPRSSGDGAGGDTARPRIAGGEQAGAMAVGAILEGTVSGVRDDLPLAALRSLFVDRGISAVFVVDEAHRLLGVVRELDLLGSRSLPPAKVRTAPRGAFTDLGPRRRERDPATAGEVMSATQAVAEASPVRQALLQMAASRVRRAPVVTPDGILLGVLLDIEGLRWVATERRPV